jgi:hypothetical protein
MERRLTLFATLHASSEPNSSVSTLTKVLIGRAEIEVNLLTLTVILNFEYLLFCPSM